MQKKKKKKENCCFTQRLSLESSVVSPEAALRPSCVLFQALCFEQRLKTAHLGEKSPCLKAEEPAGINIIRRAEVIKG